MAKIALINPGVTTYNEQPPMGLITLASYLEKFDHKVIVIDRPKGDNLDVLDSFKPNVVGITGTTSLIDDAYFCADFCRKKGIYTVMGGIHVSILPKEAIQYSDAVVVGEGETKLLELIESKEKGIFQGEPIKNLDDIPTPAYHLLDMEFYCTSRQRNPISIATFSPSKFRIGWLLTSRGCPYRCTYCYNSFRDFPLRYKSPELVIEEIRLLKEKYKVDSICFLEDNIFIHKKRLTKLCNLMIEEKFNLLWSGNSRVDNVNEDILEIAYEAGCLQLAFGFESASQRILDILNKKATVQQSIDAIRMCNEKNVIAQGNFMIGNPTETEEEIKMTQKFMTDHMIDGGLGISCTIPFPGTELWNWCLKKKLVPKDFDWSAFKYTQYPIPMHSMKEEIFYRLANETFRLGSKLTFDREISRIGKLRKMIDKMGVEK